MHKTIVLRGKSVSISGSDDDRYFSTLEHQIEDMALFNACLATAPGVMYDIGANIGVTASAAHDRPVYAFEPSPQARHFLIENTKHRPDVVVTPCALGREAGEIRFTEGAMLAGSHVDEHGTLSVPVKTLDTWRRETGAPPPAFVKVDVEGHEQAVIEGGIETLKQGPLILMEVNPWTLDAFGGIATSVFLEGVLAHFGAFSYIDPAGEFVTANNRNGVLQVTYNLLSPKVQPWTDIAFSTDLSKMHGLAAAWKVLRPR